jgi:hypothetical protein
MDDSPRKPTVIATRPRRAVLAIIVLVVASVVVGLLIIGHDSPVKVADPSKPTVIAVPDGAGLEFVVDGIHYELGCAAVRTDAIGATIAVGPTTLGGGPTITEVHELVGADPQRIVVARLAEARQCPGGNRSVHIAAFRALLPLSQDEATDIACRSFVQPSEFDNCPSGR